MEWNWSCLSFCLFVCLFAHAPIHSFRVDLHRDLNQGNEGTARGRQGCGGGMGDRVYTARVPLAGFEGLAKRLPRACRGLANRHALVFVVPAGGSANGQTKCLSCFDFLPVDPTSPTTLARMLLNLEVQGETRHREMSLAGGRRRESWVFQGEAPDCVNRAKVGSHVTHTHTHTHTHTNGRRVHR